MIYNNILPFLRHQRTVVTILMTALALSLFTGCKQEKQVDDDEPSPAPVSVTPAGDMTLIANNGPFIFHTSGGGTIEIVLVDSLGITITHEDFANFKIELWVGALFNGEYRLDAVYETLNGKTERAT